ncbi:acyl-CoA dehydrogenase family protein [Microcella pacifica]|uniref:Acyl-CoA dehydrogenase n=1 Tax=Microcella pacifica TaxID=2591847 RepID=A0A9E5JKI5_9MICO|nr:acyl-CoA dehydrogenase family protein [Microcella pacifica]NHF62138.1 acyl-CoA dehydrogenase [Microcella pacifica]
MQFDLTDEQQELVSFVRELLTQRSDSGAVRAVMGTPDGFDRGLWAVLCGEIGAASLAIPEEFGGAGFSSYETHLVLEELGYALTPSPFLASAILATQALLVANNSEASTRLLPGIADGSHIATLAWAAPDGRWRPDQIGVDATPNGESWSLSGEVPLVAYGAQADTLLVIARTSAGVALFEITGESGVTREETSAMDPTLRFTTVRLTEAQGREVAAGGTIDLELLRARVLTAVSALQVGTAARGLDMTLAYAGQRVQFGRTIGSFQVVKHRLADMYVQLETARTASRAAAWAVANDSDDVTELARIAKVWCSRALDFVASETVQLHGGIAITWEHDAHLVFKRAHATAQLFASPSEVRREVEESLLAASA